MKAFLWKYCRPIAWITIIVTTAIFWSYAIKWIVLWARQ